MNDLQLLDKFAEETCRTGFIPPFLFRDIEARGLTRFVDHLPPITPAAKAIIRARLAAAGRAYGDEEINHVAADIKRLEFLRGQLNALPVTEAHRTLPLLKEMQEISGNLLLYYGPAVSK